MRNYTKSLFFKNSLLLFTILNLNFAFSAEIADISFSNTDWVFTSGVNYDPVTEEITITGNPATYEYARITINLPGGTSNIYLSGDIFLENIVLGGVAWYAPKIKIVDFQAENLSSPAQGSWYNAFVSSDLTGEAQVTLEFGIQNSSGTYMIKNPKVTDTEPVPTPYSFPYPIPFNTTCTLNLNSNDTIQFNNDLLSTNSHFAWASKSWGDAEITQAFADAFPQSNYRFPGGTVGNFYDWTTDGYHNDASTFDNPSRQNAYNNGFRFGYTGFKNQVINTSGSATLMFNVIHDDVAEATSRLQSRLTDGLGIKWVELGNESYYNHQSYGYISGDQWQVSDVTEYINQTKALATAFKAVDNTIGLTVNINHHDYTDGGWSHTLAAESYYDAATMHNYNNVGTASLDYSSGVILLDSYKYTRNNISKYKTYFGTTPMVVSEWGVLGSESFMGVISAADMFLALLEGNTADEVVKQAGIHMLYHSDSNSPQSLIYLDGSQIKYTPNGVMYAKLFDMFKDQVIFKNLSESEEIITGLPGTISRAVDLGDSIRVFSVNKLPVTSKLIINYDGNAIEGDYRMESYAMSPELWPNAVNDHTAPWSDNTSTGDINLPEYSITVTTIAKPLSIGINDNVNVEKLNIYPNPVQNQIFLSGISIKQAFEILDVNGRVIISETYNSLGVDVSNLSSGVYLIKSETSSIRFIKK